MLKRLLGLGLSAIGADLETEDVGGTLQSSNGVNLTACDQGILRWNVAREERVSVGEDASVGGDLRGKLSDFITLKRGFMGTYVDVEIGIVDIKTVSHLLEVDMSDAIAPNIMVIHNAELRSRRNLLNEGLRRLEVSPPLGQRRHNARLSGEPRIAVISLGAQTERIKVDRATIDVSPRRHERRVRKRRAGEQRDERGGGGQTHGGVRGEVRMKVE